jgi:DNA-binding MarR family transcriptional regulator
LVQELVHGGYLARKDNARDRRQVRLHLTRKGMQTLRSVTERRKRILGDLLSSLSTSDRADLNRILGKIIGGA